MTSLHQRLSEIKERVENTKLMPWEVCNDAQADFVSHVRRDIPLLLEIIGVMMAACEDMKAWTPCADALTKAEQLAEKLGG